MAIRVPKRTGSVPDHSLELDHHLDRGEGLTPMEVLGLRRSAQRQQRHEEERLIVRQLPLRRHGLREEIPPERP